MQIEVQEYKKGRWLTDARLDLEAWQPVPQQNMDVMGRRPTVGVEHLVRVADAQEEGRLKTAFLTTASARSGARERACVEYRNALTDHDREQSGGRRKRVTRRAASKSIVPPLKSAYIGKLWPANPSRCGLSTDSAERLNIAAAKAARAWASGPDAHANAKIEHLGDQPNHTSVGGNHDFNALNDAMGIATHHATQSGWCVNALQLTARKAESSRALHALVLASRDVAPHVQCVINTPGGKSRAARCPTRVQAVRIATQEHLKSLRAALHGYELHWQTEDAVHTGTEPMEERWLEFLVQSVLAIPVAPLMFDIAYLQSCKQDWKNDRGDAELLEETEAYTCTDARHYALKEHVASEIARLCGQADDAARQDFETAMKSAHVRHATRRVFLSRVRQDQRESEKNAESALRCMERTTASFLEQADRVDPTSWVADPKDGMTWQGSDAKWDTATRLAASALRATMTRRVAAWDRQRGQPVWWYQEDGQPGQKCLATTARGLATVVIALAVAKAETKRVVRSLGWNSLQQSYHYTGLFDGRHLGRQLKGAVDLAHSLCEGVEGELLETIGREVKTRQREALLQPVFRQEDSEHDVPARKRQNTGHDLDSDVRTALGMYEELLLTTKMQMLQRWRPAGCDVWSRRRLSKLCTTLDERPQGGGCVISLNALFVLWDAHFLSVDARTPGDNPARPELALRLKGGCSVDDMLPLLQYTCLGHGLHLDGHGEEILRLHTKSAALTTAYLIAQDALVERMRNAGWLGGDASAQRTSRKHTSSESLRALTRTQPPSVPPPTHRGHAPRPCAPRRSAFNALHVPRAVVPTRIDNLPLFTSSHHVCRSRL